MTLTPYYETPLGKLYHGDCLEIMPRLDKVDLVLTDPPYNFEYIDGGGFARKMRFYKERRLEDIAQFDFNKYIPQIFKITNFLIAFHSRDQIVEYAKFAEKSKVKFDLHIWHKTNAVPFTNNTWKSDIEYIALIWKYKNGWAKLPQHNYEKTYIAPLEINRWHPAQKPLPLLEKYLNVLIPSITLDPFLGGGSLAMACERLNRRWIGIEIEEKYCEIAAKRIENERKQLKLF